MDKLRLSVSKLKCFEQCKLKYKFTYIDKLPRKEQDFLVFGKFCHSVLENFHLLYINGSNDPYNTSMSKVFKNAYEEYKPNMTKEMKKECWDIINKYLKIISTDKENCLSTNVISCEKEFLLNLDNKVEVIGLIDRIQIDNDNVLHVLDYKTTKNTKFLKDDVFQLLTYAYALYTEDYDIKKIRTSYILLKHDFELFTKEFKVSELLAVKDKYLEYAEKILNEKNFDPTPSKLCDWCDFAESCPKKNKKEKFVSGEINW